MVQRPCWTHPLGARCKGLEHPGGAALLWQAASLQELQEWLQHDVADEDGVVVLVLGAEGQVAQRRACRHTLQLAPGLLAACIVYTKHTNHYRHTTCRK